MSMKIPKSQEWKLFKALKIDIPTEIHVTPMMIATFLRDTESIKLFIKKGADPTLGLSINNKNILTPLECAMSLQNKGIITLFQKSLEKQSELLKNVGLLQESNLTSNKIEEKNQENLEEIKTNKN